MLVVRGSAAAAPHMLVLVLAGQGAFAQNWPARGILPHFDHLRRDLDFGELLGFGGMFQRRQRRLTAGDDLRHLVEVSGADEPLVLCRRISVAELAGEFLLLQARVGGHLCRPAPTRTFPS